MSEAFVVGLTVAVILAGSVGILSTGGPASHRSGLIGECVDCVLLGWSPFLACEVLASELYVYGVISPALFVVTLTAVLVCCAAILVGCVLGALITALTLRRDRHRRSRRSR